MSVANGIVVQADGKILANTRRDDGGVGSFQGRYNADGSLDTTFGKKGVAAWAFDTSGSVTIREPVTQADEDRLGIDIVGPDGKVIHLGLMTFSQGVGREAITRYNADGSIDNTFGDHGKVVLIWAADATAGQLGMAVGSGVLHVQADGKILFARPTGVGAGADLQVVRLNANGQIDLSFGNQGVATAVDAGVPRSLVEQADGRLVVATDVSRHANIVRFNADGSLDATFGNGGVVSESTVAGGRLNSRSLTVTADGKLVFLGDQSTDGPSQDFVIRYNADGTRDATFNGHGKQMLLDTTMGIVIDDQGRIVTAGYSTTGEGGRDVIFSQRVNADGTIDAGYGEGGTATIAMNSRNYVAQAMALAPDGDLVIAGTTSVFSSARASQAVENDVLLVRLQGGAGASAGVQRAVTGHRHRSPKQAARAAAAAAAAAKAKHHHRSPRQRAREAARAAEAARLALARMTSGGTFQLASQIKVFDAFRGLV
jgi:uncharacterized delta-60 repeat protein